MKKTAFLALFFLGALLIFAGCGNSGTNESGEANPDGDSNQGTRIITDYFGREVEVPEKVEKIVPLGNAPRMVAYLGLADQVVGLGGMNRENITPVTAYAYAFQDLWADIPIVGTDAAGATDYYPEEIIALQPDVIFCSYTKELADEIQNKTGTPVVAIPMGTLFEKDYEEALTLIADVCGVPEKAVEVIAYINDCLKDLARRTAGLLETDKPSILGAAATFKGAHGIEGVYINYPVFATIGANDVTKEISEKDSAVIIDKEQVLGWDPQFIFFDSGGVGLVQEDYAKNPGFYRELTAVNQENLYQYPSSTSYYSNVEIPIVNSYYVGSILFPEQFADLDFRNQANEVFKFFLGVDDYLNELEKAGAGYEKVILGAD